MKLWHDDVRPAPEGWVWARTNQEAMHYLATGEVAEISLDHDLGYHDVDVPEKPVDGDVMRWADDVIDVLTLRGQSEETGLDLVKWMCREGLVPERVSIHSWNPPGARAMAEYLSEHGYDCSVAPYQMS